MSLPRARGGLVKKSEPKMPWELYVVIRVSKFPKVMLVASKCGSTWEEKVLWSSEIGEWDRKPMPREPSNEGREDFGEWGGEGGGEEDLCKVKG